ncbi:MAG: lytic murein transglycosylase [Rubrobacter sp.]|nr:lytic murein transglycosylase [Rubrobacter sp.]
MREEAEARRQDASEPRERPANQGGGQSEGASGAESRPAPSPATNGPAPGRGDGPGAGAAEQRERAGGAERGERPGSSGGRAAPADAEAEARLRELQAEARAGELPQPATGGSSADRQRELGIARDRIVSRPVDEIPLREYEELYKEAAEEYGFEEDWYILAAVGKVESDHGQNLGPSSAGALGPMQFMPSTWEEFAVDGNGDGTKNIMDPEDAIPAAARYLSESGAPEDWYAALFTYNRADWYVKKVLGVAEGYRQLAEDDSVGPYNRISSNR